MSHEETYFSTLNVYVSLSLCFPANYLITRAYDGLCNHLAFSYYPMFSRQQLKLAEDAINFPANGLIEHGYTSES